MVNLIMRILYDSKNSIFKNPYGCLKSGEECTINIHIPESCRTNKVFICFEGQKELRPELFRSHSKNGYDIFTGTFSLEDCGLYFYYFYIETETSDFRLFRYGFDDTNIEAAFDLVLAAAKNANPEDIPETLVIISDMQINSATSGGWRNPMRQWTEANAEVEMARIKRKWDAAGLKCPKLVYWNVNASQNTILDSGRDVTFVSGCSATLFEQILRGVTGYDLMLEKLLSSRYEAVK